MLSDAPNIFYLGVRLGVVPGGDHIMLVFGPHSQVYGDDPTLCPMPSYCPVVFAVVLPESTPRSGPGYATAGTWFVDLPTEISWSGYDNLFDWTGFRYTQGMEEQLGGISKRQLEVDAGPCSELIIPDSRTGTVAQ